MANQGKRHDDAYVIEDDVQKSRLLNSPSWLKTRSGKVATIALAAVVLGAGTAIAGIAGSQVSKDLPVDTAHHYVFDPNLNKGYQSSPYGGFLRNSPENPFSGKFKPAPWMSHGSDQTSKPKHMDPLGPPNPENKPGGKSSSNHKPNPNPTKK